MQTFITTDLCDHNHFVFTVPGNNTIKVLSYKDTSVSTKIVTLQASHAAPLLV
jgi:hypothetical protein